MGPNDSLANHPMPVSEHQPPVLPSQPTAEHVAPVHTAPVHAAPPLHAVPSHAPEPTAPAHTPQSPVSPPHMNTHTPVKQNSPLYTLGLGSLVVVILGWLVVSLLGVTRGSGIVELDKKLDSLDTELSTPAMVLATAQYNTVEAVVTQIKKLRDDRLVFNPTWQVVKQNVPKDVQFTSFTLGEDGTFRVVGVGRSVTSVAQFAAALAQQGKFTTVTPLAVDKQPDKEMYNFSLSFKQGAAQ